MSQTKAQLIQPIGIVTAGGVVVTGVVTASSFDGDVVGTATSIISGGNLNLGDVNATTFSGDFTGNATGIITGAAIKVGSFTATSFTGDFTGTATSMMRGTGFKAGAVNATGFHVSGTSAGAIAGNVTGDVTGDVTGVSTGNVTGNVTGNITGYAKSVTSGNNIHVGVLTAVTFSGDGSNLTGIAATNFNTQTDSIPDPSLFSIDVTSPAGGNYTLSGTDRNGSVSGSDPTVTVEIGDTLNFIVDASGHPFYIRVSDGGANVSTPAATNQGSQSGTVSWTPNTVGTYYYQCGNHAGMLGIITVTGSVLDLSAGNCITLTQDLSATVAFANTETAMDVSIIHKITPSFFSSGGVTFDATNDYLSLSDSADFDLGSGDFTIECWVYGTTFGGYAGILGQWPQSGGNANNSWVFETVGNDIDFYYCHDGANLVGLEGPTLSTNQWHHIAVTRSSNIVRIFKDGVSNQDHSVTHTFNNSTGDVTIGGEIAGGGYLGGTISNLRLIKGTALYTGTFAPPFEELTNVTNTKLLCCQSTSDATVGAVKPGAITANGDASALSVNIRQSASTKTLTWPDSVKWDGGTAPTLITNAIDGDSQQFQLITRDSGLTWYAWEPYNRDVAAYTAFGWGYNDAGSLGLNDRTQYSSPVQLGATSNWKQAAAGDNNRSALIDKSNNLWIFGDNQYGGLGQNAPTTSHLSSPTQIPGTWSVVTCGQMGAGGVKTDGTMWAWGRNDLGQLGLNNGVPYSSPVQIPGTGWSSNINHVSQVANTDRLAIKTDGTLWMWGRNNEGVLGQNNKTKYSSPVQVGTETTWQMATFSGVANCFAIKTDGTLWSWGYESYGYLAHNNTTEYSSPKQVGTDTNWADVGGGKYASCATKTDGTLWSWGSNAFGELGGNFTGGGSMSTNSRSSPIQIPGTNWLRPFAGSHWMGCLKTDGTYWGWGSNFYGALGLNQSGSPQRYSSPVQLPGTWATDRETIVARQGYGAWAMQE
jgi:alpha-tubulin suppressor-like RCC1 family protein/plastocyanin